MAARMMRSSQRDFPTPTGSCTSTRPPRRTRSRPRRPSSVARNAASCSSPLINMSRVDPLELEHGCHAWHGGQVAVVDAGIDLTEVNRGSLGLLDEGSDHIGPIIHVAGELHRGDIDLD